MASVDDRIVRMEFDNAAFERKVSTTLTSLSQLDKALKFENAGQGLTGLQGMMDKFNLGNIGTHIESASAKFLAFGALAVGVLANVASKAVDAGLQMAKSLVLEAPMAGFREYELKMGSIQTIMAGSGESLDTVNKKLQELNEYSDKTIYSFKDMTSNIGKFTNAGISLDQSVASIQGIANVAAISGANAEEASRAMYNFAQALSRGNVQLIDWKSIEMANMATKEFKQQLIDSAVAAGTLTKRGEEYITTAGKAVTSTKGFNDSLTDGWLTTEALNATLGRYSDTTTDIGKRATAAAQDIKTFTQMMSTLKETAGSGWSQTFEVLFGNFEEGKHLWTELGTSIGDFVNKNADARNKLLSAWAGEGGRNMLILSLANAAKNLGEVIAPIKKAFQEVFPPMTVDRLVKMTQAFAEFTKTLKPSEQTVENIGRIFKGLFSILEIGWEVIKQGVKFFGTLFEAISGASSGSFLAFLAKIGDFFTGLNKMLVEGEGIKTFFAILAEVISIPISIIGDLKDKILDFFGSVDASGASDKVEDSFGRLKDRFQSLSEIFEKITGLWEPVRNALMKIKDVLSEVAGFISEWFGKFIDTIADAFASGNFSKVLDALNVGLFGGLLLVMNKFINKGIKIQATLDGLFGGGLFQKIEQSFDGLTKVLGAMQAKIKAEALMKIATAIAILTASVLVLSLIDSENLTKALLAMSVGFGQLMGAFAILSKITIGPSSAASFTILAAGMIVLSSAILILAGAAAVLGKLDWGELSRGLVGISALLVILGVAAKALSGNALAMIGVGVGITAMAVGLTLLAGAVSLFALIDTDKMAKGFIAIGAGLLIIAGAMQLMPNTMILSAAGLVAVGIAMNMLAGALKIFATMSWGEIGKGLVTLAGALVAIGLAMNLMPTNMLLTAPALVAVAFALNIIAGAMKVMGTMDWGEVARGLTAMAGSLIILAVATTAMSGSIPGAVAIGIVAGSLLVLAMVLKAFASIDWDELLKGLAGIALTLGVLGGVAYILQPAVGALLGLGAALLLLGAGFALFGVGVNLVAEGLAIFVDLGPKAGDALVDFLQALGRALPAVMTGLAKGLMEMVNVFAEGIPELVAILIKLLDSLLSGLEKLIPKALVIVGKFIAGLIHILGFQYVPAIVAAGMNIIMSFLQGIRDNIDEIVTVVGEIITGFIDALSEQVPAIVISIANLFSEIFLGVAEAVGKTAGTLMFGVGIAFIDGFLGGMGDALGKIWPWIKEQFNKFIDIIKGIFGINSPSTVMKELGVDIITGLFNGIVEAAVAVKDWFLAIGGKVLEWIGDVSRKLWDKGVGFVGGLLAGILDKAKEVTSFYTSLAGKVLEWIGDVATKLKDKGVDFIKGLAQGIEERWNQLIGWVKEIPGKIKDAIPNPFNLLLDIGRNVIQGMWDGIKNMWNRMTSWISDAASHLPGPVKKIFGIGSPSKVFAEIGGNVILGFSVGMKAEWEKAETQMSGFVDDSIKVFSNSIAAITSSLGDVTEFQPKITPVLDLTEVKAGAQLISDYISTTPVIPVSTSYDQASTIASAPSNVITQPVEEPTKEISPGVKFEQNIYAPSQLSTSDIYKQTRNQITMAKEELNIA